MEVKYAWNKMVEIFHISRDKVGVALFGARNVCNFNWKLVGDLWHGLVSDYMLAAGLS